MPLKVTSMPIFLIPSLQPFQNGGHLNFWGGCQETSKLLKRLVELGEILYGGDDIQDDLDAMF
jgi:hypothetical protein